MTDATTDKGLVERQGWWTHDDSHGHRAYYFAPANRTAPPYLQQREVTAILDIASDGTLAGVELVHGGLPPPPESRLSRITAPVGGVGLETTEADRKELRRWTEGMRWLADDRIVAATLRDFDLLTAKVESLSARLRVAEEALEPFAEAAATIDADIRDEGSVIDFYTPDCQVVPKATIRYGDLRRAASIRARGES